MQTTRCKLHLDKETICLTSTSYTGPKLVSTGLYSKFISSNVEQFSDLQYSLAQFSVDQYNTKKGLRVLWYQGWKWWIFKSANFLCVLGIETFCAKLVAYSSFTHNNFAFTDLVDTVI